MVSTNRTWLDIEGNFRWARSHLWNLEVNVRLAGKREQRDLWTGEVKDSQATQVRPG
jgi:hypothetical protein